jgi:hypothetical protein
MRAQNSSLAAEAVTCVSINCRWPVTCVLLALLTGEILLCVCRENSSAAAEATGTQTYGVPPAKRFANSSKGCTAPGRRSKEAGSCQVQGEKVKTEDQGRPREDGQEGATPTQANDM